MVFVFEGDDVVAAIVVVKVVVFGNAAVVKTIVLAGDVDVRAFAGDAVAVVVEDKLSGTAVCLGRVGLLLFFGQLSGLSFCFCKNINKSGIK